MTHIAFIGLGKMGRPMAGHLLKAGFSVSVYDAMPDAAESLCALGARLAHSVEEVTKDAEVVITMVQTGKQVKGLCLDEKGIFSRPQANLLYIDSSSIDIATTLALHTAADNAGIAMLDAPVSGGVAGAEAGTLTFMVGGEDEHFQRALPVLNAMGKNILSAGKAGHGQAAKICNNLLLGISMIGVSEAFALAGKLGLDQKKFFDISSRASGQCWSMTSYCPVPHIIANVPANNDYQPGFTAKMMIKDLHLSQQAAETVHAVTPLGSIATALYELYASQGFGEADFSGIIRMFSGEG